MLYSLRYKYNSGQFIEVNFSFNFKMADEKFC